MVSLFLKSICWENTKLAITPIDLGMEQIKDSID